MAKQGVLRSKGAAQDGNASHSSGTVEEVVSGRPNGQTYSFDDQTLGSLTASSSSTAANVSFDTSTDARGNTVAINVTPL